MIQTLILLVHIRAHHTHTHTYLVILYITIISCFLTSRDHVCWGATHSEFFVTIHGSRLVPPDTVGWPCEAISYSFYKSLFYVPSSEYVICRPEIPPTWILQTWLYVCVYPLMGKVDHGKPFAYLTHSCPLTWIHNNAGGPHTMNFRALILCLCLCPLIGGVTIWNHSLKLPSIALLCFLSWGRMTMWNHSPNFHKPPCQVPSP